MMDSKKERTTNSLLELVRLGIGHATVSGIEGVNWTSIFQISKKHGISAIVLDGINAIYSNGISKDCPDLPPNLKLHWISYVYNSYEKNYLRYASSIGRLANFYNTHGYRLMILKGYSLSLNYPRPDHRPCGDIDTWAFGDYRQVDEAISRELGIKIDKSHHHHTVYNWYGYGVENHYDFVNVHYGHKNAEMEEIFKDLAKDDSYSIEVNGNKVYLPSPNLNALFLLRHTMLHFASTSMTIRQLLDWGFFIKNWGAKVDWEWLSEVLKTYDMTEFFDIVNAICVQDLGFDASDYPYVSINVESKYRVLSDMIFPEFSQVEPEGQCAKLFYKLRRRRANTWKRSICYNDEGVKSFLNSLMSHIIKPKG